MDTTTSANTKPTPSQTADYWTAFRQMPVVLQAYAAFVCFTIVFICLAAVTLVVPNGKVWIRAWGGIAMLNFYMPTMSLIATMPTQTRRRLAMLGIFVMIGCSLAMGVADTFRLLSDATVTMAAQSGNGAWRYPPVRPVLYVAVPVFWILMLLSPQVRRWMRTRPKEGPVPLSLVDLFYFVFVAAICTSLSIALVGFARHRLEVGQTLAEMLAKSKAASQASLSPAKTP